MVKSLLGQAIKSLFVDSILEILYFPIWWYSKGLKRTVLYSWRGIKNTNFNLGLVIMFKHIFKPMYGQYDRAGRIISFFMRLVLLIVKLITFIFFVIFYIVFILFWISLPLFTIYQIIFNLPILWQ
tara:strand:+ start:139 stop:516 length:378 start_codon:yes stop_codon:yes gene_type:complete